MKYCAQGAVYKNGQPELVTDASVNKEDRNKTMAYRIMQAHSVSDDPKRFHIRFDGMLSHDITYVGIIQTARASGLSEFPIPYALTNCHNSLCAVGGTINEDDHVFGLSAAKKYGGIYVPANQAVIHQYAREEMAGCGKMLLGSDSHTRYGALGCMGIGEGGPELVKQLLKDTYDIVKPEVVLVYLTGKLNKGVGPHDVALSLCKEVFGTVKNMVLEFAGPGTAFLSAEERIGIDVMTTETACLSSIWQTDETIRAYLAAHRREEDYTELSPEEGAFYDHVIYLDLSEIEPMIALPFHPSNAVSIRELKQDPHRYLDPIGLSDKIKDGKIMVDQGEIAGCSGGLFENIQEAAAILKGKDIGDGAFTLNVYPTSSPVELALAKSGAFGSLIASGAVLKPCFCGPCFGAGDVPSNGGFSIRHTTRNFPSREGSKPSEGQQAFVGLMDARSIAATAANHGVLTGADEIEYSYEPSTYTYDAALYAKRCYNGWKEGAKPQTELVCGPNIKDWPVIEPMKNDLLLEMAAVIRDEVTTTDELIPSGETSSYRSNPLRLAEFALSRREPHYVERAKKIQAKSAKMFGFDPKTTALCSAIFCNKPGDGSAREQAASCQRVLGAGANFAKEYATKRYRSNVINWGMLPFTTEEFPFEVGTMIFIPGIKKALEEGKETVTGYAFDQSDAKTQTPITLSLGILSKEEREILLDGCLMNYYKRIHS